MLVEYQADSLDAPSFEGVLEGEDVSSYTNQGDARVKLDSRQQKFRETWKVSREQQLVATAGVPSEVAYAKAKAMKQLRIDKESAIGSDNEAQAQSGSTKALMRGLGKWIDSSNGNIDSSIRTPSGSEGTTSSLDESNFNSVLQSAAEQHGEKKTYRLFTGSELKKKISDFQRADTSSNDSTFTVTQNAEKKKITLSVMKYDGDFGMVDIILDFHNGRTSGTKALDNQAKRRGYLIDPSLVALGYLEPPRMEENDDEGGGRRGYAEAICTLMVKNPSGLGKFSG